MLWQLLAKLGEPWSSGYGRRLTFQRSWVWIPAPDTGWIWHFSHWFVVEIILFVWKRPKINEKEAGDSPFKKNKKKLGGSHGLMVMEGDSCSEGCAFESPRMANSNIFLCKNSAFFISGFDPTDFHAQECVTFLFSWFNPKISQKCRPLSIVGTNNFRKGNPTLCIKALCLPVGHILMPT